MRCVIFAAIVCLLVNGILAEFEEFQKRLDTCTKKLGADPEAVKAVMDQGTIDDHQVKCVLACTLEEEGSMNEVGKVDKQKMLETLPTDVPDDTKDKLKEAINECADEHDEDKCQTAYQIFTCITMKLGPNEE